MDLFPGAPRFNNIKPRTRAEREGLRDREAIEKVRLKERVGGFHRYEEFSGVGAVEPKSTLHMPESERFASDFAAEDRARREAEYQQRQAFLNGHRQEVIGREVNRWQQMEEEEARKQQYLAGMAAKWKQGQKNNPSAAYNPITLEYDTTEQGQRLKEADDAVRYRAGLRLFNLDQKMNSGYNILSECGKGFRRSDKYKEHLRRHDARPNLSCPMCPMKFLTDKALKSHELHTHVCTYNDKGQMMMPFLSAPNGRICRTEGSDVKIKLTKSEKIIVFHCPGCRYMSYDHIYWEVHIQVRHGNTLRYRSYQRWYGWKTPFRL